MQNISFLKNLVAGGAGMIIALFVGYVLTDGPQDDFYMINSNSSDEVHVHADFLFYINDEPVRLTDDKYQATAEHLPHGDLHLHDNNDEVLHRHADNVTFVDFINSLGFNLTDECITVSDGTEYCSGTDGELILVINGERKTNIREYIFAEEDRILLYFGDPTNPKIRDYVDNITTDACIYSGTCPERGVPPPENCGLTCDV